MLTFQCKRLGLHADKSCVEAPRNSVPSSIRSGWLNMNSINCMHFVLDRVMSDEFDAMKKGNLGKVNIDTISSLFESTMIHIWSIKLGNVS